MGEAPGDLVLRRRFVVQRHELPSGEVHFDLMIERGETLATWKLEGVPAPGKSVAGERSFDHRKIYLEYEGEVSGNRGHVRIVARGDAEDLEGDPDSSRYVVLLGDGRFEIGASGVKSL